MTLNVYGIVVLSALVFDWILSLASDLLNIRAFDPEIPEEFSSVCDPDEYRRVRNYLRVNTVLGLTEATVTLALTITFWGLGGFGALDRTVRAAGFGQIPSGLFYFGSLILLKFLVSLPFSVYSTFVVEERFGFNQTTWSTFVLDRLKAAALLVILGAPILSGVIAFFEFAGSSAWLWAWGTMTAVSLFLQFVAPVWIMPMFNKFTPLEEGRLRDDILSYLKNVDFPAKQLFVIDGSRRSSHSNAFIAGFGPNRRIAFFDTLVQRHTHEELLCILAHEVGHWKRRHIQKGMLLTIAHSGIMLYLLSIFLTHGGLYEAFAVEPSIYVGFVLFGMLYAPAELILSLVLNIFSRRNEFQADRYCRETAPEPSAMVSALKRLSVDNLSNLTPHPLTVFLRYSHPPVLARIRALNRDR